MKEAVDYIFKLMDAKPSGFPKYFDKNYKRRIS